MISVYPRFQFTRGWWFQFTHTRFQFTCSMWFDFSLRQEFPTTNISVYLLRFIRFQFTHSREISVYHSEISVYPLLRDFSLPQWDFSLPAPRVQFTIDFNLLLRFQFINSREISVYQLKSTSLVTVNWNIWAREGKLKRKLSFQILIFERS